MITWKTHSRWVAVLMAAAVTIALAVPVWGHGGKAHTETVTALTAVQKAMTMFDALVAKNKIDQRWETSLTEVVVAPWSAAGAGGWVVRFARSEGAPAALYIFLDPNGGYAGSNFTGPQ